MWTPMNVNCTSQIEFSSFAPFTLSSLPLSPLLPTSLLSHFLLTTLILAHNRTMLKIKLSFMNSASVTTLATSSVPFMYTRVLLWSLGSSLPMRVATWSTTTLMTLALLASQSTLSWFWWGLAPHLVWCWQYTSSLIPPMALLCSWSLCPAWHAFSSYTCLR